MNDLQAQKTQVMMRIPSRPLTLLLFFSLLFQNETSMGQDLEWVKRMGGSSDEGGTSIAIDDSGNVYTTGWFRGTTDLDPSRDTFELSSSGGIDAFLARWDASGELDWAKMLGGPRSDVGNAITVGPSGNIYITGEFEDTIDVDPGTNSHELTATGVFGAPDIFVAKYDPSGGLIWGQKAGGVMLDEGRGIGVDSSENVYVTGNFRETADFDPGPETYDLTSMGSKDIFLWKLKSDGDFEWVKGIGGPSEDIGHSIAVERPDHVHVTGTFSDSVEFGSGGNAIGLVSSGYKDIFIAKWDRSGNLLRADRMGGPSGEAGKDIAVDGNGNTYVTGSFGDTVDFDPGSSTHQMSSEGNVDAFVIELDPSGAFVWAGKIGGPAAVNARSIAIAPSGRVHVTGDHWGTADLDPGSGTHELSSNGELDVFLAEWSGSGDFISALSLGGNAWDQGNGIAVNSSGIPYSIGSFEDTLAYDTGNGTGALFSKGMADIFVSKREVSTLGIERSKAPRKYTLFPNPTSDKVKIRSDRSLEGTEIRILSTSGKVLKQMEAGASRLELELPEAAGLYFIELRGERTSRVHKVIKR